MRDLMLFGLGFALGGFWRDVSGITRGRYFQWKAERAYRRASDRMEGCGHARTVSIDIGHGVGPDTLKCIDCLALKFPASPVTIEGQPVPHGAPDFVWIPNNESVESAQQRTRDATGKWKRL